MRTPSPRLNTSTAHALPTPPSSAGKGVITAPTWSTANAEPESGANLQLPQYSPFDSKTDEVDEIISVRSNDDAVKLEKGKEREKPRKRKRSTRERTRPPQKRLAILSESPPDEEALATPPPTPPTTKPAHTGKDKGKGAMRPSPRPSETGSEYEMIQPPSGFDRFLDHGLGPEEPREEDGFQPMRRRSSKAGASLEQLFPNRVPLKREKTPVAPDPSNSRYAIRVEDAGSEDEKSRHDGLKSDSGPILKTRTPTPSQEARAPGSASATVGTEADLSLQKEEPTKDSPRTEPLAQLPEQPEQPPKEMELEQKSDAVGNITTAIQAATLKQTEEEQTTGRGTMTELVATREAAAQTEAIEPHAHDKSSDEPAELKPVGVSPTLAALAGGGLASLLPALMALQQGQQGGMKPEYHAEHDCALECEVCRVLATVLHGLHRGGMLGSCCGRKQ